MSLDLLISKYLDGDLLPEEDDELRSLVAGSSNAREAFDAAVLLHIAMRCESDGDFPEDLTNATFAAIDALSLQHSSAPPRAGRSASPRGILASIMAILILSVPVGDLAIRLPVLRGASDNIVGSAETRGVLPRRLHTQPLTSTIEVQPTVPAPGGYSAVDQSSVQPELAMETGLSEEVQQEFQEEYVAETVPSVSLPREAPEVEFESHGSLVLSTYMGIGVAQGAQPQGASLLSQSIGYAISEGTLLGIEIGSVSTTAEQTTRVVVRGGSNDLSSQSAPEISKFDVQRLPGPNTGEMQSTALVTTSQLWGAVFVQHRLLHTALFDVHLRGGVGADVRGLNGYGRVTGSFELGSWVSLHAGAEIRSSQNLGSGVRLVTGIQFSP